MLLDVPYVDLQRVHVLYQDDDAGECVGSYERIASWADRRDLPLTQRSFTTVDELQRGLLDVEQRHRMASTLLHVEFHGSPTHDGDGICIDGRNRALVDVLRPRTLTPWALLAGGCWLGKDAGINALRRSVVAAGVPIIASCDVTYAGTLRAYVLRSIGHHIDSRGALPLAELIHPSRATNGRQVGWRVR